MTIRSVQASLFWLSRLGLIWLTLTLTLTPLPLMLGGVCPAAWGQTRTPLPLSAPSALGELIAEGLANNQAILALEAEAQAAKNRIATAGALPDPKVGLAALNLPTDSFRFDEEPMTQKQIAVEQKVPWLSKLELQSETMQQTVRIKKAELASARLALSRDIADAYYEMGYVAESRNINARLTEMLGRIRRDAQSRYAVGKGLQQNLFQAEVELSRLQDEAVMLENRLRTLSDRIHALLNRNAYHPLDAPQNLPDPDFAAELGRLKESALSGNPQLQALKSAIRRARTDVELAEKAYFPDVNLRLAYAQRDEDFSGRNLPDFFSAAVMMDVPLWHRSKQSKDLAAASHQLQSAESRHMDLRRRLPHRIHALLAEIEDTQKRYRLYTRKLIPQAEQWARSAQDSYEVGRAAFDAMIEARMRLLRYERAASRLKYSVYQKRAALEALIGEPIRTGR